MHVNVTQIFIYAFNCADRQTTSLINAVSRPPLINMKIGSLWLCRLGEQGFGPQAIPPLGQPIPLFRIADLLRQASINITFIITSSLLA